MRHYETVRDLAGAHINALVSLAGEFSYDPRTSARELFETADSVNALLVRIGEPPLYANACYMGYTREEAQCAND